MPVIKYKSFEEAEKDLSRLLPNDPIKRLLRLQEIINRINPPKKIQRGVFKFKSITEANTHRDST